MITVFISYSTTDHYFAELAAMKLAEAGIVLWRDHGHLRAGSEWRSGIEKGINESIAILLALSEDSTESPYVTFEWAYALGKGKIVVPIKLETCKVHPRLEPIQYIDFSIPAFLPWELLIERIREIDRDATSQEMHSESPSTNSNSFLDPKVSNILEYLNQKGFQMISYERIRKSVNNELSDDDLDKLVIEHPDVLRKAVLKEGKRGLAKM